MFRPRTQSAPGYGRKAISTAPAVSGLEDVLADEDQPKVRALPPGSYSVRPSVAYYKDELKGVNIKSGEIEFPRKPVSLAQAWATAEDENRKVSAALRKASPLVPEIDLFKQIYGPKLPSLSENIALAGDAITAAALNYINRNTGPKEPGTQPPVVVPGTQPPVVVPGTSPISQPGVIPGGQPGQQPVDGPGNKPGFDFPIVTPGRVPTVQPTNTPSQVPGGSVNPPAPAGTPTASLPGVIPIGTGTAGAGTAGAAGAGAAGSAGAGAAGAGAAGAAGAGAAGAAGAGTGPGGTGSTAVVPLDADGLLTQQLKLIVPSQDFSLYLVKNSYADVPVGTLYKLDINSAVAAYTDPFVNRINVLIYRNSSPERARDFAARIMSAGYQEVFLNFKDVVGLTPQFASAVNLICDEYPGICSIPYFIRAVYTMTTFYLMQNAPLVIPGDDTLKLAIQDAVTFLKFGIKLVATYALQTSVRFAVGQIQSAVESVEDAVSRTTKALTTELTEDVSDADPEVVVELK